MELTFAIPHPDLLPYFTVYYMFQDEQALIDDGQRADCGHFRLFLEGNGQQRMPNGHRIESGTYMLTGPHSTASRFVVRGPLRFAGISLRPRAWGGLFNIPASDILDSGCDGEQFLPPGLDTLRTAMQSCANIQEMATLLDSFLLKRIRPISS